MRTVAVILAAGAVVCAALACADHPTSNCLESNAQLYPFRPNWDSTVVFRWPASRMPVRVYAETVGELSQNTDSGLQLWATALRCGGLSFVRTADSTHADIIVRNPATMPPIPAAATLAAWADSVGACTGRTDGDIDTTLTPRRLIGPLHSYVASNSSDTAAVRACYHFTVAHELGHALGLLNHSADPADLMYVVPRRRVASINDRFTIEVLYRTAPTVLPPP